MVTGELDGDIERIQQLIESHKVSIIDKSCAHITFFASLDVDGDSIVYFGSKIGFARWQKKQVN